MGALLQMMLSLLKIGLPKQFYDPNQFSRWQGPTVRVWVDPAFASAVRAGMEAWRPTMLSCGITLVEVQDILSAQISAGIVAPFTGEGANETGWTLSYNDEETGKRRSSVIRANVAKIGGLGHDLQVAVWTHEWGHALGIDNHADDKRCVMNKTTYNVKLTDADRVTMLKGYGK